MLFSFSIISHYFDDSETQYQVIKLKKTADHTARTGYETQFQKTTGAILPDT